MRYLIFVLLFAIIGLSNDVLWEFPLKKQEALQIPVFQDDQDFHNFELAVHRQLAAFQRKKLKGNLLIDGKLVNVSILENSLNLLLSYARDYQSCIKTSEKVLCLEHFNEQLRLNFDFYRPDNGEQPFFTGYYTPIFYGSRYANSEYSYAIYKKPVDEDLARRYSRVEIDLDKKLQGYNLEIFHIDNPFDLYLLHVEGGGKIVWEENGEQLSRYLSYNGTNRKAFRFIASYMLNQGFINNGSVKSQREFLNSNPQLWREIYGTTPSYVYFKETDHPPYGVWSMPLTDGRSIAQDMEFYRIKGLVGYVVTSVYDPDSKTGNRTMRRFMIDQDTGGAIDGKARADLYIGEGDSVKPIVDNLKTRGDIVFLLRKTE